ncbi:MAG: hypothetical protein RMX68_029480 [Aulosira sp. ZfuVER01]|nr:hypothetical protein [Aulosira sp. ZfuVER01]MDZ7999564.1 hypothetical protein [Aulosira sp. DedVER01a]MDZ8053979.1 hypothetical protein [Aulosira sp. ZfuCHP01]
MRTFPCLDEATLGFGKQTRAIATITQSNEYDRPHTSVQIKTK